MADNNDNLGEEKKISEDILDISNKLVTSLKERFKLGAQVNENERLLFGVSKQLQQTSLSLTSSMEKRNNLSIKSKDLAKEISKLEVNKEKSLDLQKRTAATLQQDQNNFVKQARKAAIDLKNNQQQLNETYAEQDEIRARLVRARGAELIQLREDLIINKSKVSELEKQGSRLENYKNKQKDLAKVTAATIDAQKAGIKATQDEIIKLNKELELRKKIERSLGLTGGFVDLISKIPGIGKFLKADEAKKDMEDLAIQMQKAGKDVSTFGNRTQIVFAGLKTLAKGFGEALLGPEAIFTFLGKAILKANEQTVALGKSLGVSKNQTIGIREEFVKYSAYVDDTFINTDRLLKAQSELSSQLGIAVKFSGKQVEDFSRLTELSGLSTDEAGKLAKFSIAAGQGIGEYTDNIREGAAFAERATNTHFDSREILKDVSKLSAGILVKFQGNPKALAAAVVQAKALGTNLETIDKIGDSLLNWESSIENELKAELITGKQLNLEKARYAALTGDQLTLTKEISSQVGTLNDFENMNVIAQQSLAQAFGLSKDELADMLLQQEAINKYGNAAAKLNKEQVKDFEKQKESRKGLTLKEYLKEQEQQVTIQDKFNNAILKLQDLIGNLVGGPLSGFIDSLTNGLSIITKIFGYFGKIGSAVKGFFGDKIGGALGDVASVATIGALITLVARSMTKGTVFNPMIVKDASAAGGGGFGEMFSGGAGRIGKAFSKGGLKGGGKAMSRILSKTLKGNALTSLAMGGIDAASNLSEGKGAGESIGRALITGLTSFGGGALGSLIAPGAGTIGGGILGGIAGDKIGDLIFGEQQQVQDGIASSNQGPFTIRNKYGKTAITSKGDSLAVSPNINNASLDLSPMINAINEVRNAVSALANKPTPQFALHVDGKQIGTAVGKQMETGTSQLQYTGYKIA